MSLTDDACARLDRYAPLLIRETEDSIRAAMIAAEPMEFRERLSLGGEGSFSAFYAPFDWVNERADIILVGVTPGRSQAVEALNAARVAIRAGHSLDDAARIAKQSASFKGQMRTISAQLMDHVGLSRLFGLASTADLFGSAAGRAHYTSVLRYPVLKDARNYSGDRRLMARPFLAKMVLDHLPGELAMLPNAWIVPFGPTAGDVLDALAGRGLVDGSRVLNGILHPGGQQWNRYRVQLGLAPSDEVRGVPGGPEVQRRTAELMARVERLSAARPHQPEAR